MKNTAHLFKALSDETRLRILALLLEGELCVCDLMATLDLPQSTVSRHLAYLRHAGLVEDRREGVWMYYRLEQNAGAFGKDLMSLLDRHVRELPQAIQDRASLKVYLAGKKTSSCG